jgi:hypothetical protein
MASLAFRRVVAPEGAEQFAVQWTPDGRYLLYGTVEAQGLCRYGYLDTAAAAPQPRPVDGGIRGCGPNGQAVGWTLLR